MIKEEAQDEETPDPSPPEIIMQLENMQVDEGEMAKFMVKVSGYPKPRISWFVNRTHAVSVRIFKFMIIPNFLVIRFFIFLGFKI